MDTQPAFNAQLSREFTLDGRVAVITGAGSGIGRETAHVLAQAGASVVLGDINEAGLEDTRAMIAAEGGKALVQPTDVSRRGEVEALAQVALGRFGRLDIWVNCAGIIVSVPMIDASEEQIDRMLAVNLKGVYAGCAVAGRIMSAAGSGAIVNLSSGGGESAVPGLALYSMTKAAVNMLTRTTAKELGPHGVRANAIAPGWIDTPMGLHTFADETGSVSPERRAEALQSRGSASPLGITGTPRDIALAVLYLASDASRFMTGQIIRPNGGVAMP